MRAKHDTTGGRSFFEVTDRWLPRAFRAKARTHCADAGLGEAAGKIEGHKSAFETENKMNAGDAG